MKPVLYVALCLVVPPLWGLASYWLFGLLERRRGKGQAEARPIPWPPEDADGADGTDPQNRG